MAVEKILEVGTYMTIFLRFGNPRPLFIEVISYIYILNYHLWSMDTEKKTQPHRVKMKLLISQEKSSLRMW